MIQSAFITRHNHSIVFSALLIAGTLLSSCSHRILFTNSSVVPAAEGSIRMSHDNNQNGTLNVYVKHLAPPERLTPAKRVYVVWVQSAINGTKNVGQIEVSASSLEGYLKTVTAYKVKRVFITGEDNANVLSPGMEPVLTTRDF